MSNNQGGTLISDEVVVTDIHNNLNQEIIKITADKLKLILKEHISLMEGKKEWIAPLGILITLIVVLVTSKFEEFIFPPATWQAIFVISSGLSALWFFRSAIKAFKAPSVEDIVEKIKKGE